MHSIHTATVNPRSSWGGIEFFGPAGALTRGESGLARAPESRGGEPARAADFARQAIRSEVISSIRSHFQFIAMATHPGLTPDQWAEQELAAAASHALAPGGQGAPALREGVEAGLLEASRQLQGLGVAVEEIAAAAEELRGLLEGLIGAAGVPGEVAFGARISQKQKTQLEIVTQEGDVVKLSLKTRFRASISGAAVTMGEGVTSGANINTINGTKLEISVDGHLNEEETAAVREVLLQVEELADAFFAGDTEAAFFAASELGIDGDQLASVAIKMSFRQRIEAAGFVTQALPVSAPAPAPAESADDAPALQAMPVSTTRDAAPVSPESASAAVSGSGGLPTADMKSAAPESPLASIGRYLAQVLHAFGEAGQAGLLSLDFRFKMDLLLSVTRVAADAQPAPEVARMAVDKLGEAANALLP